MSLQSAAALASAIFEHPSAHTSPAHIELELHLTQGRFGMAGMPLAHANYYPGSTGAKFAR